MADTDNQTPYDRWLKADAALLEAMQWGDSEGIAQASKEMEAAREELDKQKPIG